MEPHLQKLANEALKLTASERAALAQVLLESLKGDSELDEAWAVEAGRRIAEIDHGTTKVIPMIEALAQLRANLR